ncbi:MAG: alginate export family protein [Candidatus Sericytochromatia bacterium]
MKKYSKFLGLFLVLIVNNAYAEENKSTTSPNVNKESYEKEDNWKFKGQVLLRGEFDGRDFTNQTPPNAYTSMRTRLSAEKNNLFDNVDFFAQIEDSRLLGESGAAVSNFKNLDLHQGFINFKSPFQVPFDLQLGRFEMAYGTERFFSALPGWNYIGRAFDGARVKYSNNSLFDFKFDLFALSINTSAKYISNATPTTYLLPSPIDIGNGIYGFWSTSKFNPMAEINVFSYYEDNRKQTKPNINDVQRLTTGISHKGTYLEHFSTVEEFAFQKGSVSGQDVTAYVGSLQGYYNINDFKIGLGADILSGNNPNSKNTNNTITMPYGNGHLYHGYMDYFTNIPDNTKNLGLNDFYLKTAWEKKEFPLGVKFDIHHFTSNQVSTNGLSTFGQEADLTLNYAYSKQGTLIFGLSGFLPSDLFKSDMFWGKNRTDPSYWAYLMTIYNF